MLLWIPGSEGGSGAERSREGLRQLVSVNANICWAKTGDICRDSVAVLAVGFFSAGILCRRADSEPWLLPLCDWYWWPLIFFLVPSYLCSPQLCQFLGGVKPKWVLHVMTWKLGRLAACLLLLFQENFLAGLSHLALSLGGQGEWDDAGKWSSTSFWVLLRFLLLLYYSGLSGLLSSPRAVFVPG